MSPKPPRSTLFPYPTLFRSPPHADRRAAAHRGRARRRAAARVGRRQARAGAVREDDGGEPLGAGVRSEEHTSELQSRQYLVCRLLLEKKRSEEHTSKH